MDAILKTIGSIARAAVTMTIMQQDEKTLNAKFIGERAFMYNGLTSINAPNVKSIGERAFQNSGLTSINAPQVKSIGEWAFSGCEQLQSVDFPELELINDHAFWHSGLTSINAPNVKSIGKWAFEGCYELQSLNLPELNLIQLSTFSSLRFVYINGPKVREIEGFAFSNCHRLKSAHFLECEITHFGAFEHCSELSRVIVPKVKSIGDNCFKYSDELKDLVVSQDLIDKHNPKSDEEWWKTKGINPQITKITSLEIWLEKWAEEQKIETRDNDSLLMLYRLNNEPEYRPSWPEIGRTCPNMPFHLLVKHCPEDKQVNTLPTLSKKIQDKTQPKNKRELLQSYTEQLRIEPKTVRDKEKTRIFDEDFNALMKTFTLKDVAKILYDATIKIDKTPNGLSGLSKNSSG